jgi:membrane protease YdiL (CAAX protease family)
MTTLLEYAGRGKNAWWRYLITVILALVIAMAIGSGVVLALLFLRLAPPDLARQVADPTRAPVFFASVAVTFGALLLGFMLAARWIQAKRFVDLIGDWRWRLFALGAGGWLALQLAAGLADFALAPSGFKLTASPATLTLAFAAVPALAVQTFAEEFVFRGYVTQGLLAAFRRPWPTAIVSGLIFGAVHYANGGPQALNAVMFGVAAAYIAIRTGGLAFTFGMHLVNNVLSAVVLVSADDVFRGAAGLFTQSAPHLVWWDTVAQAAVLILVVFFVVRATRRAAEETASSDRRLAKNSV